MNLINTVTHEYPRSLWQLRQENPNVSFPAEPTDDDLLPFDHANVHPTTPPACDPRTERVEDTQEPQEAADGTWQQVWIIRNATEEEIVNYDIAHAPPPDWRGFTSEAVMDPVFNSTLLSNLISSHPGLYAGAICGLNMASNGDPSMLISIIDKALEMGILDLPTLQTLSSMSENYNLGLKLDRDN